MFENKNVVIHVGFAIGVAILGSIGSAVYRDALSTTLPTGISDQQAYTTRAPLGGALDVATRMSPSPGTEATSAD